MKNRKFTNRLNNEIQENYFAKQHDKLTELMNKKYSQISDAYKKQLAQKQELFFNHNLFLTEI